MKHLFPVESVFYKREYFMRFYSLWLLLAALTFSQFTDANSSIPTSQSAEPKDEIARLDQLIAGTEQSLKKEKELREILVEYKKAEVIAIKNPNDTDNLLKLVSLAKKAHQMIMDTSLDDYFAPQFLEELKKLSQISERKNVPAAK